MDEITGRYDVDWEPRSLHRLPAVMNGPMFTDDRVAVLGDFLRTCDSMMSGFESLCDGIEPSVAKPENPVTNPIGRFRQWSFG